MKEINSTKYKNPSLYRISVNKETQNIFNHWRVQILEVFPDFYPKDRELVEWVVGKSPLLTRKDITELHKKLFDRVKRLETLLKKIKSLKMSEDGILKDELLSQISFHSSSDGAKKKKKSSNKEASTLAWKENPNGEVLSP